MNDVAEITVMVLLGHLGDACLGELGCLQPLVRVVVDVGPDEVRRATRCPLLVHRDDGSLRGR